MILLEVHNRAVEDILSHLFECYKNDDKFERIDHKIADYDGVIYRINTARESRKKLCISISIRFFKELLEHGVKDLLQRVYGNMLQETPESGYNVTLSVDFTDLPVSAGDCNALARKIALLKRNCFASVFEKFFMIQSQGVTDLKRAIINYRDDETLYIQAMPDRVTVIFSTIFKDADDIIIGKLFMQEFTEARRRLDRAPQVLYSGRVPPSELQGTSAATGDNIAYITFGN
ncbi:unnamed protein product [Protopolystoma xenopodis]|uniref:Arp2/3 complex 34 kDa subunit n=1 Tax=Protopolystoma xenopodis TaxID=117903 RepID=A0A3S5AR17_9PLAT|nr:unnamed protein product [Protopolystoma xenopodis]